MPCAPIAVAFASARIPWAKAACTNFLLRNLATQIDDDHLDPPQDSGVIDLALCRWRIPERETPSIGCCGWKVLE